jgi:type I restriction enzyme R subunit
MSELNEDAIEQSFIEQLVRQGYTYHYGPDIAPNAENAEREAFDSVLLHRRLKAAIERLNPELPESARQEAFQKIRDLGSTDLMENNECFHTMLTNGVNVEYIKDYEEKGVGVKIIDIENIDNNEFWLVNQLVLKNTSPNGERSAEKRLDIVLYVNGLPLVVVELKNAANEKATIHKAFTQIQNYKSAIPSIFYYNSICIISDGIDAKASSLSAPFSRYLSWKSPKKACLSISIENDDHLCDKVAEPGAAYELTDLQTLTKFMLEKETLINLIRFCTVFEKEKVKDKISGLVSQITVKKLAAYHQYYAVRKAIDETVRATRVDEGDRKVGVVWHTQGSGKSLSMVFYSGQIVVNENMNNPTVVVLTDRNDLDDQLFTTFGNCVNLLRQTPKQAESRANIKELLKVSGGGIIFTTIQKFSPEEGNVFDTLSERSNIVVMADEAHRSQYGFVGRVVDTEEGSEIRYGNAKYLRDALPNASFIGFTGTPIEKVDKSTPAVFGDYIDVYDIKQAVDDGATVPISYESRLIKVKIEDTVLDSIDTKISEINGASEQQIEIAKKRNANIEAVVGQTDRLKDIAKDIVYHFVERQKTFDGKAMIVCMSRKICCELYEEIIALRPDWHSDDIEKACIKVVMTSSSDDPVEFQKHHTTKQQRKDLSLRMKDVNDELKIVIVRDMWLTGFDAPCLNTMYVDKKMQGANLMQAIARVNRVYKDKPGGLIVDYIGIGQDLRNAMATYLQSGGDGDVCIDISEAIAGMLEKFEIVEQMFHEFMYKAFFKAETAEKLRILLAAQNFIISSEDLKNRFIRELNLLSKLYAMSVPSAEAESIKDEIAFFQAIKARINKFTSEGGKSDIEVDTAVKQIVDEALASDGVIDIFEAAGIKSPSVGILSDEFLLEVKNMQQKNVAFELLKKLLSDEVRERKTKNIVQGKKFSEMLASAVKRYHNNQIDSAQVLHELAEIAKEMRVEDNKAGELGLSDDEYAFYSVLSVNDSTKMLDDYKMKELIHAIVDVIRKNATVDWSKRDDVRAKLRLTVKKLLIRYGYPPDLARMEADRVIAQGESLASVFAN